MLILMAGAVANFAMAQPRRPAAVPSQEKTAPELFGAGQEAHAAGKLQEAIDLYLRALQLDPTLWQAELQLASARFSLGRFKDAGDSAARALALLKEFDDSSDQRKAVTRAELLAGEIAIAGDRPEAAEASFNRVLQLTPDNKAAMLGLARIFLAGNRLAEAIAKATTAIAAGEDSALVYELLGNAYLRSSRLDEALANINMALQREPQNPQALSDRADIFMARNEPAKAAADLQVLASIRKQPFVLVRLARALRASRLYDDSIKVYQQVLEIDGSNDEASTGLAEVLIESGNSLNARAQLETLIKANPRRADLHSQLAVLVVVALPEIALREYRAASEIDPGNPSYLIGEAFALVKLRRFEEAIKTIKSLRLESLTESQKYTARANLATALFELKDFPAAAQEYVWMMEYLAKIGDKKKTAITSYFLGICFDRLGDFEQALKAYHQFMTLASTDQQLEIEKVKLRLPSLQRQAASKPKKREN